MAVDASADSGVRGEQKCARDSPASLREQLRPVRWNSEADGQDAESP
jgi:hypothetical protein